MLQRKRPKEGTERNSNSPSDADEQVPAHQWIAESAGEQAAPGDHALRPTPPHIGFEGHVEHPHEARGERSPADSAEEKIQLVNRGNVMGVAQPFEQLHAKDERGQPARSADVPSSGTEVAPGEEGSQ